MPDPQNYSTRLRTHSQLLPPRRLRPSPSPPPRHRLSKSRSGQLPQPQFPPAHAVLHPDDASNRTFLAIGRALVAVENRAVTIKDLSHLTLDYGLLCQSPSAASQAITTFIRNHLNRCHVDRSRPLLLSLPLSGTSADDRLAPALHSRSGGTSSAKGGTRSLTSFRRGTTVWYLSESAGAPCPFQRAGLSVQEITSPAATGTKRKRETQHMQPRKLSTPGPAMATRHRVHPDSAAAAGTTSRLRVRLTVKPRDTRAPSPAVSSSAASESDLTDIESLSERDAVAHAEAADDPVHDSAGSDSGRESSIQVDAPDSPQLPPYPILSPSIPSPSCSTPATCMASPLCSDPFASYRSAPCSGQFIKSSFSSFRTALSNPPRDHRARSRSLPFSAASPPPDSEDEDEDYHNSMVGLRRGSVPPAMKQEDMEAEDAAGYAALAQATTTAWVAQPSPLKQAHTQPQDVSTPLELLPGFVSFSVDAEHVSVKDEPTSAVLPPDRAGYGWGHAGAKPARAGGGEDEQRQLDSVGSGTREDPVRIDAAVHDVEVLGPESVISREWDVAWTSGAAADVRADDAMDTEASAALPRACAPLDADVFACGTDANGCASPATTLLTASTSISSPPLNEAATMDSEHEPLVLMHPLRSCDPPVVATIIEGIPVYHTYLAPGVAFLRRIDTSFVNLTPLMALLGLPLSALVSYTHAAPRMTVSCAAAPIGGTWVPLAVAQGVARHAGAGLVPGALLEVFLSADLGLWFPDALGRLVQLHAHAAEAAGAGGAGAVGGREGGIRAEDVFVGAGCVEFRQDARVRPDVAEVAAPPSPPRGAAGLFSRGSSLFFEAPRSACAALAVAVPLNEQEERLFHSLVDLLGPGVSATSSPLSSAPSSPVVKPAAPGAAGAGAVASSANGKENAARPEPAGAGAGAGVAVRRRREKGEAPVRRSKRALAAKASAPVTRSRTRTLSG